MSQDRPEYLGRWTFDWKSYGYHLAGKPDVDLLSDSVLASPDPWAVLTAVLEHAKAGDFTRVSLLLRCIRESDHPVLWRACFDLMGDAGPSSFLRQMLEDLRPHLIDRPDPEYLRHAAYALHESHLLWGVPIILDFYLGSPDRRDLGILTVLLSRLLENEFGPIAEAVMPDGEYRQLVLNTFHKLKNKLLDDNIPVLYGDIFSVRRLAEKLYQRLLAPQPDSIAVLRERQFFEASTGVDCSAFFSFGELDVRAARPIVEDFLLSGDAVQFDEGVRYFFRHPIA